MNIAWTCDFTRLISPEWSSALGAPALGGACATLKAHTGTPLAPVQPQPSPIMPARAWFAASHIMHASHTASAGQAADQQ